MKELKITSQFKKDLKKYQNQPKRIEKLKVVLGYLQQDIPIKVHAVPGKAPTLHSPCGENVGKENRKTLVERILRGFYVPGAGIEPARIAPLVFETSASTDSAIRAFGASSCSPFWDCQSVVLVTLLLADKAATYRTKESAWKVDLPVKGAKILIFRNIPNIFEVGTAAKA